MSGSFTSRLRLSKQQTATNDRVWGSVLNSGFIALLDDAIAGSTSIDMTAADVSLTTGDGEADQARCMTLLLTGAAAAPRVLTVPAVQKVYAVHNACGQSVTVKTAGGVGLAIANNTRAMIFVDEATDRVYQPVLPSTSTVAPNTTTMDAYPSSVNGAGGGTTTPTVYFHREGDHLSLTFDSITVTAVASAAFQIVPQSGTYPVNSDLQSQPHFVYEGVNARRVFMTISPSVINFSKFDSSGWTNPSDRTVLARSFSFRVQ